MTEIGKGLSVDLSSVGVVERAGADTIIYIHGRSFIWRVAYETALRLIDINNRSNSVTAVP